MARGGKRNFPAEIFFNQGQGQINPRVTKVEEALAADWWIDCLHPDDKEAAVENTSILMTQGHLVQEAGPGASSKRSSCRRWPSLHVSVASLLEADRWSNARLEGRLARRGNSPPARQCCRKGPFATPLIKQPTGADDQGCDHQTYCNVAIARPQQLAPLELLLARSRCPFFRLLAFCNVGPEPDSTHGAFPGPCRSRSCGPPPAVAST